MQSPAPLIRRPRRPVRRAFYALPGLVFALLLASGSSDSRADPETNVSASPGVSSAENDTYVVALRAPSSCKAGRECTASISLRAKGAYRINDEVAIRFKAPTTPPEGVSYTKSVVKRADGTFGTKEGTLPVGFTIANAGKAEISGTFSFSVCTDANCVMDKVELHTEVDAK